MKSVPVRKRQTFGLLIASVVFVWLLALVSNGWTESTISAERIAVPAVDDGKIPNSSRGPERGESPRANGRSRLDFRQRQDLALLTAAIDAPRSQAHPVQTSQGPASLPDAGIGNHSFGDSDTVEGASDDSERPTLSDIRARWTSEAFDAEWTQETDEYVRSMFEDLKVAGEVEEVSCRSTVCMASLVFDDMSAAQQLRSVADDSRQRWTDVRVESQRVVVRVYDLAPREDEAR